MRPGDSFLWYILTVYDIHDDMSLTLCHPESNTLCHPANPHTGQIEYIRHSAQLKTDSLQPANTGKSMQSVDNYNQIRPSYCDSLCSFSLRLNQSQHDAFSATSLRPLIALIITVPFSPSFFHALYVDL